MSSPVYIPKKVVLFHRYSDVPVLLASSRFFCVHLPAGMPAAVQERLALFGLPAGGQVAAGGVYGVERLDFLAAALLGQRAAGMKRAAARRV